MLKIMLIKTKTNELRIASGFIARHPLAVPKPLGNYNIRISGEIINKI
jgi:hypothetical protein